MTHRPGATAIVLAGGRSTRFGGPKLAAEVDGLTLLDRAIDAVRTLVDEVIVAGAPVPAPGSGATSTEGPPIRTIADEQPFAGPLAALAGALGTTSTELAILVGGDMPGLAPAVLDAMLRRLDADPGIDAVLLADPATEAPRRQVLPLALRVATASAAAVAAVGDGDRSLARLIDRLRTTEIAAPDWLALDPTGLTLLDVDRPDDLRRILGEMR